MYAYMAHVVLNELCVCWCVLACVGMCWCVLVCVGVCMITIKIRMKVLFSSTVVPFLFLPQDSGVIILAIFCLPASAPALRMSHTSARRRSVDPVAHANALQSPR